MGCGASVSSTPPYEAETSVHPWKPCTLSHYNASRGINTSARIEGAKGISLRDDFHPEKRTDGTNNNTTRRLTSLTITDTAQNVQVATVSIACSLPKQASGGAEAPAFKITFDSEQLAVTFARGKQATSVVKAQSNAWYATKLGTYSIDQAGYPSVIKLSNAEHVVAFTMLTFGAELNVERTLHVFLGDVDLATAAEKKDTDLIAILDEKTGSLAFRESDAMKHPLGLLILSRARLLNFSVK